MIQFKIDAKPSGREGMKVWNNEVIEATDE
jgi:hypothetical protein